jgi:hypothetical protein
MRVISKSEITVLFGLMLCGGVTLAQGFLPGQAPPDYRPVGALVFRQDEPELPPEMASALRHTAYVIYISALQDALLDTNSERLEQQAGILEISAEEMARLYVVLNEFNTRWGASRRSILEKECAPLLAGTTLSSSEVRAAVARIEADEPREEILQSVLQNVRDTFGDDVMRRLQSRVDQMSRSGQLFRIWELEQTIRAQSGDSGYLNEQCAVLQ